MRGGIIRWTLVAAVAVVMLQGTTAWASSVSVPLSQTSLGDMAVDDTSGHVFLSSPADNSVAVYDFSGNAVKTITGISGAEGMVIHGSTLYVAESTAGKIEEIDLSTLTDSGSLTTGLNDPQRLVYAGTDLWTTTNPNEVFAQLTSVSLSGTATVFPTSYYQPTLATAPGTPDTIFLAGGFDGVGEYDGLEELDVSSGSPVAGTTSAEVPAGVLAVSPDGTHVVSGSGALDEFSTSTLASDGVVYPDPASEGANAAAVSPADGGLLATGFSGSASTPGIIVYKFGSNAPVFTGSIFGANGNTTLLAHGIALSGDGSTAFAVGNLDGVRGPLRLWAFGLGSSSNNTTTTLGSSQNGNQVSLTATVSPTDGSGKVTFYEDDAPISGCGAVSLVNTSGSEAATCTTTSLPTGDNSIMASYGGDSAYSGSFASADVTVQLPPGSDYTWTGAASIGTYWSYSGNWDHQLPPYGSVGTLTFPNISSANCSGVNCYVVNDNIFILAANSLVIDSDTGYTLNGDSLSLGAGGLTVESPDGNGTPPVIEQAIELTANQTWTIDEGPVGLYGSVDGDQALTVDFDGGSLEPENMDVGPITATGTGGFYLNEVGELNAFSSPVTLENNAGIEADGFSNDVGPLTVDPDSWVSLGGVDNGGAKLQVRGALTFNTGSELDLAIDAPGTMAGIDYSEVTATGNVNLSGAQLDVTQGADSGNDCVDLNPGDQLMLLSTSGTISGTFSNYPDGATVDIENDCDDSADDATGTINYTSGAVTLTITHAGDAGLDQPLELSAPSLSGSPVVGQTLQLYPGSWEGATSYAYSWWECDANGNCTQIPGADGTMLKLTSAQLGDQVGAIVVATGPDAQNSDSTDVTDTVTMGPVPGSSVAPVINGALTVGSVLTSSEGTWTNSPSSYSYQWERCSSLGVNCAPISGATASSHTLTSTDVGSTVEVSVTATNGYGPGLPASSKPTAVVTGSGATAPATNTVSAAIVKSDLHGVLRPTGSAASLQTVLAKHGYAFNFSAPGRGKLTVTWTATVKHKIVTLAKGSVTVSGARKVKVSVRLTSTGASDLKRYAHIKIKSEVGFKATNLKQVDETAAFTLSGKKTAHTSVALSRIAALRRAPARPSVDGTKRRLTRMLFGSAS